MASTTRTSKSATADKCSLQIETENLADGAGQLARLYLSGTLDFATVPVVLPQILSALEGQKQAEIDLTQVDQANSAALAMLIEVRHLSADKGADLRITGTPESILKLAEVCQTDEILQGNPSA